MDIRKLNFIGNSKRSYNEERIGAEIAYAYEWSVCHGGMHGNCIDEAVGLVYGALVGGNTLTDEILTRAETILAPVGAECKKQTIFCAAHAHMDMAWKWGYSETVSVVISTVRTVLALLKEYPDFKYSQSQAASYQIVAEHAPWMIGEIKKYIREGRWEVSGCSWVEADKNMPAAESCIRQITEAKKYLSALLEIPEESLDMDFEPDTFGHSAAIPDILTECGVKYYYHCRGNDAPVFTRWQAKSGKELFVYREPLWYNAYIYYDEFAVYPALMKKYKLDGFLKVYGIGDHGGGPTRRDIERLIDMSSWPCMPTVKFSTYREYFEFLRSQNLLPEIQNGEKNYIFSGCYTSQSRIKEGNRRGERFFKKADEIALLNELNGIEGANGDLTSAWQRHLFNQFHDILPGSNVADSREYAMGAYQKRDAAVNSVKTENLLRLSRNLATDSLVGDAESDGGIAEGAGVGFTSDRGVFSGCLSGGKTRLYLLHNDSDFGGERLVKLLLWDYYDVPLSEIAISNSRGEQLEFQVLNAAPVHFYSHFYHEIAVKCAVPAHGYTVLKLSAGAPRYVPEIPREESYFRRHKEQSFVLENDVVRAEFDPRNARLVSLTDKRNEKVYALDAGLKFALEDATSTLSSPDNPECMTAWIVGRYLKSYNVAENVSIQHCEYVREGLLKQFVYRGKVENSSFEMRVTLGTDEYLRFELTFENRDYGKERDCTPSYLFNAFCSADKIFYTDQLGMIQRPKIRDDMPSQDGVFACKGDGGIFLSADAKYGYRADGDEISVSLIRNTTDPDPYPEIGVHKISIALAPIADTTRAEMYRMAKRAWSDIDCISIAPAKGTLKTEDGLFEKIENALVAYIKRAENGKGIIVRLVGCSPETENALVTPARKIKAAYLTDCTEKKAESVKKDGNTAVVPIRAGELKNLYFEFQVIYADGKVRGKTYQKGGQAHTDL